MKTSKLFVNGRSQEEQALDINQMGQEIVLHPYHASWQILFDSLDQFSDDFLADGRQQDGEIGGEIEGEFGRVPDLWVEN